MIPWGDIYRAGNQAYLDGYRWGWLWATLHLKGWDL